MILDKLKTLLKKPNPYNPHLEKTIADIGLTTRTYHILRRAEIWIVGDLVQLARKDIKSYRGSVRRTVMEVERVLKGMGLSLKKEEER